MEQGLEYALLHLLLQNIGYIGIGFTCMDNNWQTSFTRCRDVGAKPLRLRRARAQVIVIIQPRLTDANYLRMLCQLNKVIHSYIKLFMRMMRMGSYCTENIRVIV